MNTPRCTKWLKTAKIGLVTLVVFSMLVIPTFAVYTNGSASDGRYYAPLQFEMSIDGTVADFLPTIVYGGNNYVSVSSTETSGSQTITRSGYSFASNGSNVLDVSYRMRFSTLPPDQFTITLTSVGGVYDFSKYGVPQIAVPYGYTATVQTTYTARYLDTGSKSMIMHPISYNYTSTHSNIQNSTIDLLKTTFTNSSGTHVVIGNAVIENYVTSITFVADDPAEQMWGSSGFYHWNTVLDPTEILEEYMSNHSTLFVDLEEDVYVMGYESDGTLSTIRVNAIYINEYDGWDSTFLEYSLDPDQTALCYNFGNDTWYGATADDVGIVLDEITAEQMRVLQFTDTVSNTINNIDEPDMEDIFVEFFEECTTYHATNPLYPNTFTEIEGRAVLDGGLYIHYYVDKSAPQEFSSVVKQLYTDMYNFGVEIGKAQGGDGGAVDFTAWLVTSVGSFMSFELIPDVLSIGGILAVTVGLSLMIAFLKFFAGG